MKLTTKKTTVGDLLALLANASPTEEVSFTRAAKKTPVPCWCGCGGATQSRFVPGHDSRFHGLAKQVARGQENHEEALAGLPHAEARADFELCVSKERPLHAAKEAAKAEKVAAREAAKAEKAAAKVAEEAITREVAEEAAEEVTEATEAVAEVADYFEDEAETSDESQLLDVV